MKPQHDHDCGGTMCAETPCNCCVGCGMAPQARCWVCRGCACEGYRCPLDCPGSNGPAAPAEVH